MANDNDFADRNLLFGIFAWQNGLISEEEGMRFATNPEALRMNLQGIFLDESRRILGGEYAHRGPDQTPG